MQKQRVVAWLAQHNFPHGIVSFCDGLVHDPLRHKANFLKSLITDVSLHLLKYDHSTGADCCSSNCPCQHQSLGSNAARSRRLISVHFIFILLLLHKSVHTVKLCHFCSALSHFITGSSSNKCQVKQREQCLPFPPQVL